MSKSSSFFAVLGPLALSSVVAGCSGSREVEVTGTTTIAATGTSGAVHLDFYDVVKGQSARKLVHSADLAAPGKFSEKVDVEGDTVHVFALTDANKNGTCDAGEAWAEADAPVKSDGSVDALALTLTPGPCPSDPSGVPKTN